MKLKKVLLNQFYLRNIKGIQILATRQTKLIEDSFNFSPCSQLMSHKNYTGYTAVAVNWKSTVKNDNQNSNKNKNNIRLNFLFEKIDFTC